MNKFLSSLLASTLLLGAVGTSFALETTETVQTTEILQEIHTDTLTSGKCGDNAYYSFDSSTGTMTISGTGAMEDFSWEIIDHEIILPAPWYSYRENIKSVVISEGITTIGERAFMYCESLRSVSIPNSVTTIRYGALGNIPTLTSLTIPSSVTTIEANAFLNCTSLSSISISDSNPNFCSENGVIFNKNKTVLHTYSCGNPQKSYEIPSSVTSIEESAFLNCDSLASITIPNSVTSIGERSFYSCKSLTSVTIGNSVTSIGEFAFGFCESLTSVTIPNSVTSIGNRAFRYCDSLTSVFIPDSVKEIGGLAFHEHDLVTDTTQTLPNVTVYGYAGSYAETWCKNYTYEGVASPVPFVAVTSVPSWAQSTTTPTTTPSTTTTPKYFNLSGFSNSYGSAIPSETVYKSGDRVTFKVTANTGYFIESVSVVKTDGTVITCGYDWVEGMYAFIMPSENVKVTVVFDIIPTVSYTPTITTTGQGSASLSNTSPSAGDVVKVTVSPSSGYVISAVRVVDASGKDVLCVKVSDGVYQYTQPSGNVSIYPTYYYAQTVVESYTDINYADWYAAYASYAIEEGLMNGTSVGVFDPDIATSRAMVALILANVSGETIPNATGSEFSDVPTGQWYSSAVEWCKSKGIVAGYEDGNFGVNDAITREQMVTILRSFASYMGYSTTIYFPERLSSYVDSTEVSSYAVDPFSWALGFNYIQGTGNKITPKDSATRAEFANILNLFLETNI